MTTDFGGRSTDTITVDEHGTLTYAARIDTKGVGRYLDPVVGVAFELVGDRAARGLETRLAEPAAG